MYRVVGGVLLALVGSESCLLLGKLICPNVDQLLQARRGEIGQGSVLAERIRLLFGFWVIGAMGDGVSVVEAAAQLLRKHGEFFIRSKSTNDNKDLAPLLQVRILHDVGKIIPHNGLEKAEVGKRSGPALKVRLLRALEKLWSTTNGQ
jgi:hypothetical protein